MVNGKSVQPCGEGLRKAVRWLAEQSAHDAATIEEAAVRFDLSPLEEDFLLKYFGDDDRFAGGRCRED